METINRVETLILDNLAMQKKLSGGYIKIDAEGGEISVLKGFQNSLTSGDWVVVLEYLKSADPDSPHQRAIQYLQQLGYRVHAITDQGDIILVSDIGEYLTEKGIDSDNLVFRK
jgi:hypothetical protein